MAPTLTYWGSDISHNHRLRNFDFLRGYKLVTFGASLGAVYLLTAKQLRFVFHSPAPQ